MIKSKSKALTFIVAVLAVLSIFVGIAFMNGSATEVSAAGESEDLFVYGASVRRKEEANGSGIKFHVVMSNAFYSEHNIGTEESDYTVGVVVLPERMLGGEDLTIDTPSAAIRELTNWKVSDLVDGYMESVAYIYNIPDTQYVTELAIVAYYTDGETYTYTGKKHASFAYVARVSGAAGYEEYYTFNKPATDDTEFIYTGEELTYNIPKNSAYTVTGNKQTDIGKYAVSVSLNDKEDTLWADGTTSDLSYVFRIIPAFDIDDELTYIDSDFTTTYSENLWTLTGDPLQNVKIRKETVQMWIAEGKTGVDVIFGSKSGQTTSLDIYLGGEGGTRYVANVTDPVYGIDLAQYASTGIVFYVNYVTFAENPNESDGFTMSFNTFGPDEYFGGNYSVARAGDTWTFTGASGGSAVLNTGVVDMWLSQGYTEVEFLFTNKPGQSTQLPIYLGYVDPSTLVGFANNSVSVYIDLTEHAHESLVFIVYYSNLDPNLECDGFTITPYLFNASDENTYVRGDYTFAYQGEGVWSIDGASGGIMRIRKEAVNAWIDAGYTQIDITFWKSEFCAFDMYLGGVGGERFNANNVDPIRRLNLADYTDNGIIFFTNSSSTSYMMTCALI